MLSISTCAATLRYRSPAQKSAAAAAAAAELAALISPTPVKSARPVEAMKGPKASSTAAAASAAAASDDIDELMDEGQDVPCMVCGDGNGGGSFVLCDGCPAGGHVDCLGMDAVPSGDWCCAACEGGRLAGLGTPKPGEDEGI